MTSVSQLARNAWAWVLDYRYVVYWQARGLLDRTDPADYLDPPGTAAPVLLLPGIYERWQFLRPVADLLRDKGHPVHVLTRLRWNTAPVAASAEHVAAYLEEHDLREVLVVAHSKGGLIGKYAMLHADPEGRIARMIAIATPFAGSRYARYFLARSIRANAGIHRSRPWPTQTGSQARRVRTRVRTASRPTYRSGRPWSRTSAESATCLPFMYG